MSHWLNDELNINLCATFGIVLAVSLLEHRIVYEFATTDIG
jgi:hypothetical protein